MLIFSLQKLTISILEIKEFIYLIGLLNEERERERERDTERERERDRESERERVM